MKTINRNKIITKESYNEEGRTIEEITQEWITENYNLICCKIREKRIKCNQIES